MKDPAVEAFFQERKEGWLKKAIKASSSEVEIQEKNKDCEDLFSLENWLPKAAERAKSRAISSHPSKFSHPSTGIGPKNRANATYVTPIIASGGVSQDGYLRTGNVEVALDSLGNAGELDVDEFLRLILKDGKSLLVHLQDGTDYVKHLFSIESENYKTLRDGFLAMASCEGETQTSSKIKQVYFPVSDGYHLLSLLTPSGSIFELKKRCRLTEEEKNTRTLKNDGEYSAEGYRQIINITEIGYGGGNPWNISELNKSNYGRSYLLSSEPPQLKLRDIQFPTVDFFSQTFSYYRSKELFQALHKLFVSYQNDWQVRAERDAHYQAIIDRIIERMWLVREVAPEQFNSETSQLNKNQKVWLCDKHGEKRNSDEDWLDDITEQVTRYIFNGYEKILGKKAFMFSDDEFRHIHRLVTDQREALR